MGKFQCKATACIAAMSQGSSKTKFGVLDFCGISIDFGCIFMHF